MEQDKKNETNEEISEEIEIKPVSGKPERLKTADFVSRYANGVVIVNTQFDIQFHFGHLALDTNDKFVVNEHTIITMSPAHAKSVFELLGRRLADWENSFGKIELKKKAVPKD